MAGKSLIGALRVFLGLDTAEFTEGAKNAATSVTDFVEKAKHALEALAAAFAVGKLVEGFVSINENLDALGKAAQKIGIPAQQLAELQYAAELADVPIESLQSSIAKFSKGLSEFSATGKGTVGEALRTIGVAAVDANGKLKPQEQLIEDIAQKFSIYRDGANKTALAIALFGKAGAELIPFLNEGKAGIKEAGDQLLEFGGVPTDRAIKASTTLLDNFKRIKEAFYAVAQQVVILVTPAVKNLTNAMVDFLGKGGGAKLMAEAIVEALKKLAEIAVEVYYEFDKFGQTAGYWYDRLVNGKPYDKASWDAFKQDISDTDKRMQAAIGTIKDFKVAADDASGGREGGKKDSGTKDAPAFAAGAITAADKFKDKIKEVIKALQIQNEEFSKSSLQMKIDEALRRAGTTAATAQGHAIQQLVVLNENYRVAQQTQLQEAQNEMDRISKTAELVKGVFQSWFDSALSGTFNLKNALADLAKSLAETGLTNILNNLFSVGTGNPMQGSSGSGILSGLGKLLGFATGGTILPGGAGGVDSQLVAFRKSPDERVDITRPGQRLSSGGGGTVVNLNIDGRGADAGRLASLEATVTSVIRTLPNTIRGVVTREKASSPRFAT